MQVPEWLRFRSRDVISAAIFIGIGVCVRLALLNLNVPNLEPVMALSLIAGMVMPLALAAIVPIAMMAVTDFLIYTFRLGGQYGIVPILGIAFFVYTGFVMATVVGKALRRRYALKVGNLGVIVFAGVLVTLVWDVWTVFGIWYFLDAANPATLATRFEWQASFTIIHVASSLIFIPLFGSGYMLLTEHKAEIPSSAPANEPGRHSGQVTPDAHP